LLLLLFVSLLEGRVIVLGGDYIDTKIDASHCEQTDAAILDSLRAAFLKEGLQNAIQLSAKVLAEHVPPLGDHSNELSNHVIARVE
jgi:uncharacterized membrane protein